MGNGAADLRATTGRTWSIHQSPVPADVAVEEEEVEEAPVLRLHRASSTSRPVPKRATREEEEASEREGVPPVALSLQDEEAVATQQEQEESPSMVEEPLPITSRRRASATRSRSTTGLEPSVGTSSHKRATTRTQVTEDIPVQHPRAFYVLLGGSIVLLAFLWLLHLVSLDLAMSGAIFLLIVGLLAYLLGNWKRRQFHPLLYIGVCGLLLLMGYFLAFQGYLWWSGQSDDARYGTPRTFQVDAIVGHHDDAAHPTHFIALNLRGRIEIIEFQGGDPTHSKVYPGPVLSGTDAEKIVVTVEVRQDVHHHGKPNLVVHLTGDPIGLFIRPSTTYLLENTGNEFKPQQSTQQ